MKKWRDHYFWMKKKWGRQLWIKKWQTRNNIDPVKILDFHLGNYDNFLVVGDFNSEMLKFVQSSMDEFCSICNLHNVCDKTACYKNP